MNKSMAKKWRDSKQYTVWHDAVLADAGFRCACCDSANDLHAHHIKHASYYVKLRFDVTNGVCLCKNCHMILHNKIAGGYRNKCGLKHLNRLFFMRDYFADVITNKAVN